MGGGGSWMVGEMEGEGEGVKADVRKRRGREGRMVGIWEGQWLAQAAQ